jgi:ketosteroid isomerase-like protein
MDKIRQDIDKGNAKWIDSFKMKDATLLASAFHINGAVLGSNGKVIEGREAIKTHFAAWMNQIGSSVFTIETLDVYSVADDIYEKGFYTLTIENGEFYEGHFVVQWKYEGDTLYFYRDIGI